MKTVRKTSEQLNESSRPARVELPGYLQDFDAISGLAELADRYSAEIARGPLRPFGAEVQSTWSKTEAANWYPSALVADDEVLQRGPGSGAFQTVHGGALAEVDNWRNWQRVSHFKEQHQNELAQRFDRLLVSNPGFIELQKVAAFRATLKAFEKSKDEVAGSVRSSRFHDPGARATLIAILANALSIYWAHVRNPQIRSSPTKEMRKSAVGPIERLLWLFEKGGLRSIKGGWEAERALKELIAELNLIEEREKQQAPGRGRKRAAKADNYAPMREAEDYVRQSIETRFGARIPALETAFARLIGSKNPRARVP